MSTASNKIQRRPFMAELLAKRGKSLIVPGLGSPTWDCFAAGDSPEYLYSWGGMGLALPTALGIALAQPDRRVTCVTGDGEIMMGIGSLAVVADQAPKNLSILVLDNEKFGETGNQASHTSPRNNGPTESGAGADLALIAKGCGIADVGTVREAGEVAELVKAARTRKGPVFRLVKVMVEKLDFVMPPQDGAHLKDRFRQALLGHP